MVKISAIIMILLTAAMLFGIYPFLDHPPIWLFEDGLPVVDVEGTESSLLMIKIKTLSDEFTLVDATAIHHRVSIPLKEDFKYEIYQEDALIGKGNIIYPSKDLKKFTMLVFGDVRNDYENIQGRIVERGRDADFSLFLGDIAYFDFAEEDYHRFFNTLHKFGKIVFTVKGNHEIPGFRYSTYFYPSYYSFRIGDYRFFVLNGNDPFNILKLRTKRLFNDFKDENTNKIAIIHEGVFDCGKHSEELYKGPAYELHKIFEKYGVKFVISSHDHNYQRLKFKDITYIIVGGGGAPLHNIKKDCELLITGKKAYSYVVLKFIKDKIISAAYDIEGSLIDDFTISF